ITDHHEPVTQNIAPPPPPLPPEFLIPDALAVINPKTFNLRPSISNLSGAGVAFKLAQALATIHDSRFTIHDFLDLAALGTIADVVPITGENRFIVKEGLNLMEKEIKPGLRALNKVSGIEGRQVKSGLLSFTIIPRINAAGRLADSNKVVDLLLADSENEAIDISLWLDKLNSERQQIEEEIYQEALSRLDNKDVGPAIVLSSKGWHEGVIGIVAARIAESFYRPTFLISIEGHLARGSARSIPPFDIYKGLTACRELLTGFGGHKRAAGFKLEASNISSFEERINRIVSQTLADKDFISTLEIDADVNFSDIHFNLIREFELLEPFGFGNPEPLLGSRGLEVLYPRIVGNNHLKMKLKQKSQSFDTIGFDMAVFFDRLEVSTTVDAVFTPCINEWERGRCLQLNLKAFRPTLLKTVNNV
ncbi:MAG: DHHA1 domain-containing protein, partial [Nitrospirota bacterium]